jgi:hypothetical protein
VGDIWVFGGNFIRISFKKLNITNMKMLNINLTILSLACSISIYSQNLHKEYPSVRVTNTEINGHIYINGVENSYWKILPRFLNDSIIIKSYLSAKEIVTFKFQSGMDSIQFDINDNERKQFYLVLNKKSVLKSITRSRISIPELSYVVTESNPINKIKYNSKEEEAYIEEMKSQHPINLKVATSQIDSVLTILNWTRNQWEHRGDVGPKRNDAMSILEEVKGGARFPCFAYAIVLASQLKASGFQSRVIYLKSKDIATSINGGGHVATEVFLNEFQKWVFVDGQFNVMPFLNNIPLNAVELQNSIRTNFDQLVFRSLGNIDKTLYVEFVAPYLFYFDCRFDQREEIVIDRNKVNGKRNLMLVPLGAQNPTSMMVFNSKIDYCEYTNSINDFYAKPD